MFKKSLAFLLGTCMVCSLAGCGSSSGGQKDGGSDAAKKTESSSGKRTVTFYSWSENAEEEFDRAVIAEFEKENPDVDVVENFMAGNGYLSKINTMAAADSMPDVFKLPEGNVMEWGKKGALLDLQPLYDKAGIKPEETMLKSTIFRSCDSIWGRWMQCCHDCAVLQQRFAERGRD